MVKSELRGQSALDYTGLVNKNWRQNSFVWAIFWKITARSWTH